MHMKGQAMNWTTGPAPAETKTRRGRHFYMRQLRDIKIKFAVETIGKVVMPLDAEWCGHTLALSHARSGDPALVSGYLGNGDAFDKALEAFSVAYADQNDKDYEALKRDQQRKAQVRHRRAKVDRRPRCHQSRRSIREPERK